MKYLKLLVLGAAASLFANSAFADAYFNVPVHYSVQLVDGEDNNFNYSRSNRNITVQEGHHQVVLSFEGRFGSAQNGRMIEAGNPIVIDFDIKDGETLTFKYPIPRDENEADAWTRNQNIQLVDDNDKSVADRASFFILTSDAGFTFLRNYRQELMSLGKLYAPAYESGDPAAFGLNQYGAPVARATQMGVSNSLNTSKKGASASEMMKSHSKEMATRKQGSASLNKLIDMYERADDKTKLDFVIYVMSHQPK